MIRQIEHSVAHLSLPELEALYYDMLTKDYIRKSRDSRALTGRSSGRINRCQTICSVSASLLAIFATGSYSGVNERILATLPKR